MYAQIEKYVNVFMFAEMIYTYLPARLPHQDQAGYVSVFNSLNPLANYKTHSACSKTDLVSYVSLTNNLPLSDLSSFLNYTQIIGQF